jgi:tetratricopeptide (TPR) repeat protein
MLFKYFNASEATDIGISLADQFASGVSVRSEEKPQKGSRFGLQEILARADLDVRPLQLNFYKKAKFANSFKWRLLEKGVERNLADEVTQSLILHLAQHLQNAGGNTSASTSPKADSDQLNKLLALAGKFQAEGNYEEAASLYRKFLAVVPRHADALNNFGVTLSRLARYQEAEQCYRQALEINPELAVAHCNLADLLQGNPKEAEECLRRALRINPKYVEARVKLGVSLASSGREHEAKPYFKKALKVAPNCPEALLGLGQIARMEGRFVEAETLIGRALKSKPKLRGAFGGGQNTPQNKTGGK